MFHRSRVSRTHFGASPALARDPAIQPINSSTDQQLNETIDFLSLFA